jgi:hypothetical protein
MTYGEDVWKGFVRRTDLSAVYTRAGAAFSYTGRRRRRGPLDSAPNNAFRGVVRPWTIVCRSCQYERVSEQAPAGWYPDGSGNERYWDGAVWTEHLRSPAPPAPVPPSTPAAVAVVVATVQPAEATNVFSKLGSAVKKAAADKKATKEEEARAHSERAQAAGALITSGIFGTSTIEIYEGGFVRIAVGGETRERAVEITKSTPYEKLRSISFASPEAEAAADAVPGSPIEGAVMQAMSGIVKGGKLLTRGTAIGLATTGVAQFAANSARKSNLVIATDKTIHTLVNQKHNGWMNISQKEHNAVALALVEAGTLCSESPPRSNPRSLSRRSRSRPRFPQLRRCRTVCASCRNCTAKASCPTMSSPPRRPSCSADCRPPLPLLVAPDVR